MRGIYVVRTFAEHIRSENRFFGVYDPIRPAPHDLNVVVGDRELRPVTTTGSAGRLYERVGIQGLSQMRVLVCDGPMLLAWVGGFRAQPLARAERLALQSLAPALQRRLALDRLLHVGGSGALDLALDAIDAPAFFVTAQRAIVHANTAGTTLLDARRSVTLERIALVLDRARSRTPDLTGDRAIAVRGTGSTQRALWLVLLRHGDDRDAMRLASLARSWNLTSRESEVLQHMVRGDANKDIATKLACAVATIEVHVTNILRKARVDSRARAIARYWMND